MLLPLKSEYYPEKGCSVMLVGSRGRRVSELWATHGPKQGNSAQVLKESRRVNFPSFLKWTNTFELDMSPYKMPWHFSLWNTRGKQSKKEKWWTLFIFLMYSSITLHGQRLWNGSQFQNIAVWIFFHNPLIPLLRTNL